MVIMRLVSWVVIISSSGINSNYILRFYYGSFLLLLLTVLFILLDLLINLIWNFKSDENNF